MSATTDSVYSFGFVVLSDSILGDAQIVLSVEKDIKSLREERLDGVAVVVE